jgi:hypothetical protein
MPVRAVIVPEGLVAYYIVAIGVGGFILGHGAFSIADPLR